MEERLSSNNLGAFENPGRNYVDPVNPILGTRRRITMAGGTEPLGNNLKSEILRKYIHPVDVTLGQKERQKVPHEFDWWLSIDTPQGVVGLRSGSWGNKFALGYPKNTESVIDSIHPETVSNLAVLLEKKSLDRDTSPRRIGILSYEKSRQLLLTMTDIELRDFLKKTGVSFIDVPYIYVPDELIIRTLGVSPSQEVINLRERKLEKGESIEEVLQASFQLGEIPVLDQTGEEPLIYGYRGKRQWAKFYGDPEPTGGRVWVDYSGYDMRTERFPYVNYQGELLTVGHGWEYSNIISTLYNYSLYNKNAPDLPTTDPAPLQRYRGKFIRLAAEIAFKMGGPRSVTIQAGPEDTLQPYDLLREEYGDVTEEPTKDYKIVLRGRKDDSIVMLANFSTGNLWLTIINKPAQAENPEQLTAFIEGDLLYF